LPKDLYKTEELMSSTNRASDSPSKTVEQEVLQIAAAIQNGEDVNGLAGDAVDDSPWRANEFSIFLNSEFGKFGN
jgi:hypothetical protein